MPNTEIKPKFFTIVLDKGAPFFIGGLCAFVAMSVDSHYELQKRGVWMAGANHNFEKIFKVMQANTENLTKLIVLTSNNSKNIAKIESRLDRIERLN